MQTRLNNIVNVGAMYDYTPDTRPVVHLVQYARWGFWQSSKAPQDLISLNYERMLSTLDLNFHQVLMKLWHLKIERIKVRCVGEMSNEENLSNKIIWRQNTTKKNTNVFCKIWDLHHNRAHRSVLDAKTIYWPIVPVSRFPKTANNGNSSQR